VPPRPEAQSRALVSSQHDAASSLTTAVAHSMDVAIKPIDPNAPRVARTIARFQLH
jgi:hypothetical protein